MSKCVPTREPANTEKVKFRTDGRMPKPQQKKKMEKCVEEIFFVSEREKSVFKRQKDV